MRNLTVLFCWICALCADERVEVLSNSPLVVLYHGFLSDKECEELIREAKPRLIRSTVVGDTTSGSQVDNRRTSSGMSFPDAQKGSVLDKIEKRIAKITKTPRENGENVQVLHYAIGQEYVPHYDYFDPNSTAERRHLQRGGQRVASMILYLNTPEKGGETIFPVLRISVKPVRGNALLFYNCDGRSVVDSRTLHGGAPVIAGEKWIATKWIREQTFH